VRLLNLLASGIRDTAGVLAANAQVYSYRAGTTTLTPLYEDFDLTDPFPNPLTLDAAGVAIAYVDRKVKLVIVDEDGATIRQIDHVGTDSSDVAAAATSVQAGAGLVVDGDGALAVNPDGTSLAIVSDVLKVPDYGISTAKLADDAVTAGKIVDDVALPGNCSTTGNFTVGDATTDTARIGGATGPDLKYKSARALYIRANAGSVDLPIVTSADPTTHALVIVRGYVDSSGNSPGAGTSRGEGWTAAKNGTGDYQITFSNAFAEAPTVIACPRGGAQVYTGNPTTVTTSGAQITIWNAAGILDREFHFIAIGIRGV